MPRQPVDGVLLLDKPTGITSNAALQTAKRMFNAAKAGHTGTLDPLASGILPLCFGEATKFSGELLTADKSYRATLRLGIRTTTGDAEGDIVAERAVQVTREAFVGALTRFSGVIEQVPPLFSALKHQGRNYYEYARQGIDIPRSPRRVEVYELVLAEWDPPQCTLKVRCSKGTYIRTLAEDIGETIGCGAHLIALRRTDIGRFEEAQTSTLDALGAITMPMRLETLLPVDALVRHFPVLRLSPDAASRIRLGQGVAMKTEAAPGICRLYDPQGVFLGVGEIRGELVFPRRLLATGLSPDREQRLGEG